jgi:adenine-specific DNA-methyltransferase
MPAEIPKLDLSSKFITDEQREKLRVLFPEIFTENHIDWDHIRQTLSAEVVKEKRERFGLTWSGITNCFRII